MVLGLAAPFLLQASAWATPIPESGQDSATERRTEKREAAALERAVREREKMLAQLYAQADAHAAEIGEEVERLRSYGYEGEVDDLTHLLPLADYRLSAGYGVSGPLWESVHTGLDMAAPTGTTLVALADGTVTSVADAGPYGLRTVLTLGDGTEVWYCHQQASSVTPGQAVDVGQPIGLVGSTGNSTGPHLHLEIRPGGGGPVDPVDWMAAHGLHP